MKLPVRLMALCALLCLVCYPSYAQTGALMPPVHPTFFNSAGVVAANGFICTTVTGTTTSQITYQDSALTTANQNPIRLNALGRAVNGSNEVSIYLQQKQYRISLYGPGSGNTCNGTTVGALINQADGVYDLFSITAAAGRVCQTSLQVGTTLDVRIGACITALPATGGVIDATNESGTQNYASCPWTGVTKPIYIRNNIGTTTISTNCTVPINVTYELVNSSILSPNSAVTLTINGPVIADVSQHFAGSGTVALGQRIVAYPQWWGATGGGSIDDTSACQAALSAMTSGGSVYFPPGSYLISTGLAPLANTIIYGTGRASQILVAAGGGNYSSSDINLLPIGVNNVTVRDIRLTGAGKSYPGSDLTFGGGIIVTAALNVTIDHVVVENANIGVSLEQTSDSRVINSYITGKITQDGVRVTNFSSGTSKGNVVANNIMEYSSGGSTASGVRVGGVNTANASFSTSVTGNTVRNDTGVGAECITIQHGNQTAVTGNTCINDTYGLNIQSGQYNVMSGNTIRDCVNNGVLLQQTQSGDVVDYNVIEGNSIFNCATAAGVDAIYVSKDNGGASSTSNKIINNVINGANRRGIMVKVATDTDVSGNMVVGVSDSGIYLESTTGNSTVNGNTVISPGVHGIYVNGDPGKLTLTGNREFGQNLANTYGIDLNGSTQYIASGNRGDNFTNSIAVTSTLGLILDQGTPLGPTTPINFPGNATMGGYIALGTNPSATGFVRLPNNTFVAGRNAANSADVNVIGVDSTNNVSIASNGGNTIFGGVLFAPSVVFASLGTPNNAAHYYCSDCKGPSDAAYTAGNTCANAGSGAFAVRINALWRCY